MAKQNKVEEELQNEAELAEELSGLSGEKGFRPFRYIVPIVKFSGQDGSFKRLENDSEGKFVTAPMEAPIKGVILNVRRVIKSFERIDSTHSVSTFSNEHATKKDVITLYQKFGKVGAPNVLDTGLLDDLRLRHPKITLKVSQILYMLVGEEVVKMAVRGKSLTSLFDYFGQFDSSRHMFDHITEITCHNEKNEGGLSYYVLDFAEGEAVRLATIAPHIKTVAANIKKSEESKEARDTDKEHKAYGLDELADEKEPVNTIDLDEEDKKSMAEGEKEYNDEVKSIPTHEELPD